MEKLYIVMIIAAIILAVIFLILLAIPLIYKYV